jgi:hypothetical protein
MRECLGEGARDDYIPRKVRKAVRFVEREFCHGELGEKIHRLAATAGNSRVKISNCSNRKEIIDLVRYQQKILHNDYIIIIIIIIIIICYLYARYLQLYT